MDYVCATDRVRQVGTADGVPVCSDCGKSLKIDEEGRKECEWRHAVEAMFPGGRDIPDDSWREGLKGVRGAYNHGEEN